MRVVNVSTIKPLDKETVVRLSKDVRAVVTCEEHSVIGGLGSAIAEALARNPKPIAFVGMNDEFGSSGRSYQELVEKYHLTPERVSDAVLDILKGENK